MRSTYVSRLANTAIVVMCVSIGLLALSFLENTAQATKLDETIFGLGGVFFAMGLLVSAQLYHQMFEAHPLPSRYNQQTQEKKA